MLIGLGSRITDLSDFELKELLQSCAEGDADSRIQFGNVFGELIYNYPMIVFRLPSDRAGDFYIYVSNEDRIFKRVRGFQARNGAQFIMTKMGEELTGFITSLANFGFFVELDAYFIEGLVKLSSLTDDDYNYYEKEYFIKGHRHGRKFRLGDKVRVRVARINAFRSEIDF